MTLDDAARPGVEPVMAHWGYDPLGYAPDGRTMYACRQDGIVVVDRHAHDDDHRTRPFMATTPEMDDLLGREPASDFE